MGPPIRAAGTNLATGTASQFTIARGSMKSMRVNNKHATATILVWIQSIGEVTAASATNWHEFVPAGSSLEIAGPVDRLSLIQSSGGTLVYNTDFTVLGIP